MNWYLKVLKNYAVFSGRARRKELWMFGFISFFIVVFLIGLDKFLFGSSGTGENSNSMLKNIYTLIIFIPNLAVTVRRIHDVGKSGWWLIVPLAILVFAVLEGTKGPNKYGPDPKEEPEPA